MLTGLAPGTVDSYIAESIRQLSAKNRRDAAEILRRAEGPSNSGYEKSGVPYAPTTPEQACSSCDEAEWGRLRPLRSNGARGDVRLRGNDVRLVSRIAIIAVVAIGAAVALGMLAVALRVLSVAYGGPAQQ